MQVSMAYDWRLAMPLMEVRDAYFTRLRATVETLTATAGAKAVLTAHSYGENVVGSKISALIQCQYSMKGARQ